MSSSLLDCFATIADPRRAQGKMYDLAPVLLVSVLAVLSGATFYRRVLGFIDSHFSRLNKAFGLVLLKQLAMMSNRRQKVCLGSYLFHCQSQSKKEP